MDSPNQNKSILVNYGGQAVIEGVMMRGRSCMAVAVRRSDGSIQTITKPLSSIYQSPLVKIPFLRSLLLIWDTLGLGMQSLAFSAEEQGDKPLSKGEWASTMALSFIIFLGVFILLPSAIAQWMESGLGLDTTIGNILEGTIRLFFLLGYLLLIGRIPEIARVFAYHGAEHKTINAFESGAELTPENVEKFPKEHPRCGTSFLVLLAIIAVLLFALVGPLPFFLRLLSRLILLPILIALGYEFLRLTAKVQNTWWGKILSRPGMWAQALTTRNPDRSMLEVAITAFQKMREAELGTAAVSEGT